MKRILSLLVCLLLFGSYAVFGQDIQIKGTVTAAEDGSPLPGVYVKIKGTNTGAATDVNGKYQLTVDSKATLIFTFIGYKEQQITLAGQSVVDVVLEADVTVVNEVVVTALGIRRSEKSLGYAATTVASDEFAKKSSTDAMNSLQGKVAGVQISSGGGAPGASTKVIIRGYSSLSGNSPLYVVDGVPIDNSTRTDYTSGLDFGNRANDINPNDIENMTILKGASATALYGSRASSGAIIITTKKGKQSDKLKIEINSSISASDIIRIPQMQNTFGQGWSGLWADDENGSWGPKMGGQIRAWGNVYNNSQKVKPFAAVEDNVYDFYDYGMQYNNSISLSGGNENTLYYLSYNNVSANGVIPTDVDKNTKNAISLTASTKGKRMTAATSIFYVNRSGSGTPDGYGGQSSAANLYSEILQIPRDFSITDFKDYKNDPFNTLDYYFTPYAFNPYFAINENQSEFYENRIYGNIDLGYELLKWMSVKWTVGADVSNFNRKDHEAIMQFTPETPQFIKKVTPNPGFVMEENRFSQDLNSNFRLIIDRTLNESFTLNTVLGYEVIERKYKSQDANIKSLVIPEFYNLSNSDGIPEANTYNSEKRQYAYYGQATVGYQEKAYLTISARQEYSSTLPKDANSFFYPSVNASILVDQLIPALSNVGMIKVRAAWGKAGNDAPVYYIYPDFASSVVGSPYSNTSFPIAGVGAFEKSNQIGNPKLKPEITTEKEIGLDIRLFDARVNLDLSLYHKVSDGQILTVNVAPSSGFATQVVNFGKVQNKGVEIMLSLVPVKTDNFAWNFTTTFTKNNNEVLSLPGESGELVLFSVYSDQMVAVEGKPLGVIRSPDYVRDNEGHIVVNATSGIPQGTTEKTEVGNVTPKFVAGFSNTLTYKNVEFSFLIDWRKGGQFYSGTADLHYFVGNATQTTFNDRQPFIVPNSVKENPDWDGVDPETQYVENDIPINMTNNNAYYYPSSNPVAERDRILPRDYVKLRDVNLAFSIPSKYIAKLKVLEGAKIVLSGRNLLMWTPKENNFVDPESTSFGNDLTSEFGEFRTGPTVRTFTAGIKLNF
jgi:TonB-linked SusC/RagA family outer membrane protein